jgi:hypothetical protein
MILSLIKRLLGDRKKAAKYSPPAFSEHLDKQHYELKKAGLESRLGPMHSMVGHAIIPFEVGGATDMYYFPQPDGGTAFATMELIDRLGNGPLPNERGTYELVAFSRIGPPAEGDELAAERFSRIERRLCGIFTRIGRYSFDSVLNPGETCEIPNDDEPSPCLVFDDWGGVQIGGKDHGLLLVLEIFPSEMNFAREHGSPALLERLRAAGHYPFSDLDRKPIV